MRGPSRTIDSSCIFALDLVGVIPLLSVLFQSVLVPKAVREECFKNRSRRDRPQALFDKYAFLERCDSYDRAAADILLLEHERRAGKDRGEAEAVVQASQRGAAILIDDKWGRKLARRHALDVHGTLWVLEQLHDGGFIPPSRVRECFDVMRKKGIRLPEKAAKEFLDRTAG
jgi:predicted nucleic acid-binding protein